MVQKLYCKLLLLQEQQKGDYPYKTVNRLTRSLLLSNPTNRALMIAIVKCHRCPHCANLVDFNIKLPN